MSRIGTFNSNWGMNLIADQDFDEVSGQTTTNGSLEDITGLTFDLTLPATGSILAVMSVECSSGGAAASTGAWAISINAVDGTEIARYMSGTNDTGAISVQARQASLAAGTYTVKGRHRRVSGTGTVNTDVAQLQAIAAVE